MGQQVQGLDNQIDGDGGIKSESLVADNSDVGMPVGEIVCDKRYVLVGTHENGHVLKACSLFAEGPDGCGYPVQRLLFVVLGRQQADRDKASWRMVVRRLLDDVLISVTKLFGVFGRLLALPFIFQTCRLGKEGVVEVNDVLV